MTQGTDPPGNPINAYFYEALLIGGGATRLYLVRHAQSQSNTGEDLTTGDPDLTEIGYEQAKRLGARLGKQRIDAIYASPLRRCQETAAAIAEVAGDNLEIIPKADLREVDTGAADLDIRVLPPDVQEKIAARVISEGTWDAFPGGEGSAPARARITAVMDQIIEANPGRRVVVVVHAGFIQTYVSLVLGLERDFVFYPFNASVHSIRAKGDRRVIWRLNDVSHLDGMPAGYAGIS
jgi:broad specificity phosphatase PhoE